MLTENLYNRVLIQPISEHKVDTLNIISGYASPSMVDRHFNELSNLNHRVSVNLIIGMTHSDGIPQSRHQAFVRAVQEFDFNCRYMVAGHPVHSKVYTWLKNDIPALAFAGSANYSVMGFSGTQKEVLCYCDSNSAQQYYELIRQSTVLCTEREIESQIDITDYPAMNRISIENTEELSLLDSNSGQTHRKAGLNWGQREGRNPNQAYIPIPSEIYKTGFFPPVGQLFSVRTDDGEDYQFVRAQERGKALHTSQNNSFMGLYFRNRIGVGSGEYVTRGHLERYGRTTVSISKLSDDKFYLDFSV